MFSKSEKYNKGYTASIQDKINYENITGFFVCKYDCKWWVG